MNAQSAYEFSLWLAQSQPGLFNALLQRATAARGVGGFADFFSSLGTGIVSAAKAVGGYITSPAGIETVTALSAAYMQTRAAKEAIAINLERARANVPPAPIEARFNPATQTYEPVLVTDTQYIPITPQVRRELLPNVSPWIIGGGLALTAFVIVLLLNRRR